METMSTPGDWQTILPGLDKTTVVRCNDENGFVCVFCSPRPVARSTLAAPKGEIRLPHQSCIRLGEMERKRKRREKRISLQEDVSPAWLRRITGCTYGRAEGILRDHEGIQKDYAKSALNDSTEKSQVVYQHQQGLLGKYILSNRLYWPEEKPKSRASQKYH